MKPPIILCDVDGVIGQWDQAFLRLLNGMTGEKREFPYGEPAVWEWPTEELCFTKKEVDRAWRLINTEGGYFWEHDVKPMEGAREALQRLNLLDYTGNAVVYFVTARSVTNSRWRTARWLKANGYDGEPAVIVTRNKGDLAHALRRGPTQRLIVIDDKPENLDDCKLFASSLYLIDHLYNRWCESPEVTRVGSVVEALEMEFKREEVVAA